MFGLELKKPVFCSSHQEEKMLDVAHMHNICQTKGCDKIPKFGVEWRKPLFWLSHQNFVRAGVRVGTQVEKNDLAS